ncbi:hypothetical protein OG21DRAFT_1510114 [Imleria badia]|nr:hypothetical protein OG21DRAFT_1510114 [Imleria badia]
MGNTRTKIDHRISRTGARGGPASEQRSAEPADLHRSGCQHGDFAVASSVPSRCHKVDQTPTPTHKLYETAS